VTRDEVLVRLWPTPGSCPRARDVVRQFCSARGLAAIAEDAELLTSELVTNAVRHSDGMLTMLIARAGKSLAVTVSDNSTDGVTGEAARLPEVMDESGRGLFVLASLAGDWGVAPGAHGKTVWFRLP
jgi:anti-sigma regulatory factor (Ser/Thr protein kinase)